jgi:hypothetical protein
MNSSSLITPPTTSYDRSAVELSSDRLRSHDEHASMFDIAESIQKLCTEGKLDFGMQGEDRTSSSPPPTQSPEPVGIKNPQTESLPPSLSTPVPAFDLLSKTFLQSIATYVSKEAGFAIGLLITSKTGRVVSTGDSGWRDGTAVTQRRVLSKLARECVWNPEPRFSVEVFRNGFEAAPAPQEATAAQAATTPDEPGKPTLDLDAFRGSVCLNELSQAVGTPLFMFPLRLAESSGFAIFFCDASQCKSVELANYLSRASHLFVDKSILESLVRQLDAWLIVQRCTGFMRVLSSLDWLLSRPKWWLAPIAAAGLALFAPIPYYPIRECVFEPESKQYLSSPIQGRIASCDVRPGEHVEKGQLLARLDDDQLQRDLATARAEFDGSQKKRDSALATRAAGSAGLADIEMKQAIWRIESIEEQLKRIEIRATEAGVVVQGDWYRSIGMPVTLGQNLFEVATLESMTAEVRLKASDLGNIFVGDEVSVRSDSSGGSKFCGKISRIEPRATVIDDEAVFVADVVIRDPDRLLRPGMKANAQIKAGWKSLGWLLFDRPYRWIANQWIW